LHPVSLALYGVIFEPLPFPHAHRIAKSLVQNRSPDEIVALVNEIELEIESPTQRVRDILENVATEAECREFLAAVVHKMQSDLPQ